METFKLICAILGIVAVVFLLIKKNETRMVLISIGLVLCLIALNPMAGLNAFAESMANSALLMPICSSMGFAFVMKFTRCDTHLVQVLTAPMRGLGFALIPVTSLLTFAINIAIPSAAGCSAAVGATLIPVLMASGVSPAMAGAAVFSGTIGSMLSPGSPHNSFVANIAANALGIEITPMDVIQFQLSYMLAIGVISAVSLIIVALIWKDYKKTPKVNFASAKPSNHSGVEKANLLYAIAPLAPLIILIIGGTALSDLYSWLAWTKMGVPQAMLIGSIFGILITLSNPGNITKEFFNGMGSAYAEVMGIIIAAGIFVAGLKATGAIDYALDYMKNAQHIVRWGATLGPFLMAVVTGSGDTAAMTFNGAVTPFATEFGYQHMNLGMAAAIAGALGRTMSPIAGGAIICAGLAGISPVEIAKRTAPGMIIASLFLALFML